MPSDAGNWDRLQTLFHLVEGVPEVDRERILTGVCADLELLNRVLTILQAADRSDEPIK